MYNKQLQLEAETAKMSQENEASASNNRLRGQL